MGKTTQLDNTPIPYSEPPLGSKEHFWKEDPWDVHLPSTPGFISDFVAHTRGYETPTAFCIWSAIFYLSSTIKREAWLEWGYGRMFPNFYIIFIGPPGIVKKGTAMELGFDTFKGLRKHLLDPNLREIKRFNVLRNKATPEAMVTAMTEGRKLHGAVYELVNPDGSPMLVEGKTVKYKRTSEISIIVPELATMLSRSDYAKAVTPFLMDIYDCKDRWEASTQSRGKEVLLNLCTNFFGGITPKGIARSIPEEASEDGFLSRCILVYQKRTARCFSEPIRVGPTTDDLSKALAWVAENTIGQHLLSPKAKLYYKHWYTKWKKELEDSERPYASSRAAVQALQLSLILKASRYSRSTEIAEQDILDAIRLVEATSATHKSLFDQVDGNVFFEKLGTLENKIYHLKKVSRRELLTKSRVTAQQLNELLTHLTQTGRVSVWRNNEKQTYVSTNGKEEYRWVNGTRPAQQDSETEKEDD